MSWNIIYIRGVYVNDTQEKKKPGVKKEHKLYLKRNRQIPNINTCQIPVSREFHQAFMSGKTKWSPPSAEDNKWVGKVTGCGYPPRTAD